MFGLLLSKLNWRCPVCHQPIVREGIRKGLRVFCSPGHVEKFAEEQEARKRALGRMSNKKAGGCC